MQVVKPDALLDSWQATLARKGAVSAIFDPRGMATRTFDEIEAHSRRFQEGMSGHCRGDVYPIALGNDPDWPAVLLACLRQGMVALPMDESTPPEQRRAALELCRAPEWDDPPVLLKLTSGTTAAPRAIRFRSEQLVADCEQICDTMGITDRDVNFGVIPVSHSYGFSNLITPLLVRGVPLVLSRDRMPRAVLDDLARSRATVFPGMPVFYQAFVQLDAAPDLPDLRLCLSAGAPLSLAVAREFRTRFGHSIHSFYGSSECGGICYDRAAQLEEPGFVGEPMQGVMFRPLADEAGRMEVLTAAAGDGYFPEPEPEKLSGGRFVPDDFLMATADGYRISGRASDVINVAGRKVNPAEVEAVLLACAGVREAVVFGRSSAFRNEEVAACVVADAGTVEAEVREFCRRSLSGWQVPKRVFFLAKMPVTERGKISRRGLAEHFAGS